MRLPVEGARLVSGGAAALAFLGFVFDEASLSTAVNIDFSTSKGIDARELPVLSEYSPRTPIPSDADPESNSHAGCDSQPFLRDTTDLD
jgi:hypothetical protein